MEAYKGSYWYMERDVWGGDDGTIQQSWQDAAMILMIEIQPRLRCFFGQHGNMCFLLAALIL